MQAVCVVSYQIFPLLLTVS